MRAFRGKPDELDLHGHADDGHGHQPGHGPAVAWLLTLPLLALLLIAPPPLGAFAAGRQSRPAARLDRRAFRSAARAATADGAIPLKLSEYVYRALYDEERRWRARRCGSPASSRSPSEPASPSSSRGS